MAYKIFMKEAEDNVWHDVTDGILVGDIKIRSGFASIGSKADMSKLTLTYRAYDLPTAAVFSNTAKCVKVLKDGLTYFEGYSEESSSVESTETSELAWVKISAYPYLKAIEDVEAQSDMIWLGKTVSELVAELWSMALSEARAWVKEAIEASYRIDFPDIQQVIPFARIQKGDSYIDTIMKMVGEFGYCIRTEGSGYVSFIKPYETDSTQYAQVDYNKVIAKPTIKTSPYEAKISPQVTLSRVIEKQDVTVYSLTGDDGQNAGYEIYADAYYPEDGDAEVSYSVPSVETDLISFAWADGLTVSTATTASDLSGEGEFQFTRKELQGDNAYYRIRNTGSKSFWLNQLYVNAKKAYFYDRSIIVRSTSEGEKDEVDTSWIQTELQAKAYAKALADESRCSSSSITFRSDRIEEGLLFPGALIKIGDISTTYMIRIMIEDLHTGITEYQCVAYKIEDIDSELLYRSSSSLRGPKGDSAPALYYAWSSSHSEFIPAGDKGWSTDWKEITTNKPAGNPFLWARVGEDGEPFLMQGIKGDPGDRIYQWRLSKYADYEGMGADLSNFKADGNLVFYNGQLLFDGNTEWIGQDFPRPVVDEDYPYLWERYSDDKGITWSEAYLVQSLMPRTIRIISSRPSFDKSARGIVKADQTITLSIVTNGIGDKAVQWTTSGGTLSSAEGRLVTLVIPKGFLENSVTVSVVSAGVSDTLTLRANTVGGTEPKKLPTVNRDEGQEFATELEDGDILIAGDYCIAIIDGYTVPCRYDGTGFVEVEGSEDNASQIMGGIIEEALSMSDTVKTGKFIYAFIKNLVATNAFIENLKAMNVIVDKDSFKFEIATTDENGTALATPVVRIQYAGSTIFQVNPKNGNVFFGQPNSELSAPESGFMYRASDKSIVSVDSKLIISADGTIKAEGADISGNINATSGSFVGSIVASSGRFNGLLETPCIRTEINSSSATVITDSISAWSGETNDWTQVRQFYEHFKKTGLPLGSFVPCTASFDSGIMGYKLKLTGSIKDANYPPISVDFYRKSYILSEEIKSYYEHWEVSHSYTYVRAGVKQNFTITSKFGGVDILLLDIPLEQGGLASNQVYRTTDGFLKIYE